MANHDKPRHSSSEGGVEMKKEPQANKPFLTDKDLAEALLLISETAKTLALEVMLLPKDTSKGDEKDVKKPNDSQ